jgi:hypothetical protein
MLRAGKELRIARQPANEFAARDRPGRATLHGDETEEPFDTVVFCWREGGKWVGLSGMAR